MRELELNNTDKVALVDDEDYDRIRVYQWRYITSTPKHGGCVQSGYREKGKVVTLKLHRLILNPPKNMVIDHINGDVLDNQKSNLRICTSGDNTKNQKLSIVNNTGYKGVSFNHKYQKYYACISINSKNKSLGYYGTAKEAADAYDKAAKENYKTFAKLNCAH